MAPVRNRRLPRPLPTTSVRAPRLLAASAATSPARPRPTITTSYGAAPLDRMVQVEYVAVDELVQAQLPRHVARAQLALADQVGVGAAGRSLPGREPLPEGVVARALAGLGQRLAGRPARGLDPQLPADHVGRVLGHQPVGRELAAHDRD